MFIGPNIWVKDSKDLKELRVMAENGARMNSGVIFSHKCNDGGNVYYCFKPTDTRVDGAIYATKENICDVFELLDCTVSVKMFGHTFFFGGPDMVIANDVEVTKVVKYKQDDRFAYSFSKTQYKGKSPYGVLALMVDNLWCNSVKADMEKARYI